MFERNATTVLKEVTPVHSLSDLSRPAVASQDARSHVAVPRKDALFFSKKDDKSSLGNVWIYELHTIEKSSLCEEY